MIINVDFEGTKNITTACAKAFLFKTELKQLGFTSNIDVRFIFNGIEVTTATGDINDMLDAYEMNFGTNLQNNK